MKICPVGAESFHTDGRTDGRTGRGKDRHEEANLFFLQMCERA